MIRHILYFLVFFPLALSAQKKSLDHTVYNSWKSLYNASLAADGSFATYEINPQEGDGTLYIFIDSTDEKRTFERGKSAQIHSSGAYLAFKIEPQYDTIRSLKIAKKKKEDFPKDSLCIHILQNNTTKKAANLLSFSIPKEGGDWMAYLTEEKRTPPAAPPTKKKLFKKATPAKPTGKPEKVKVLYVENPLTGVQKSIDYGAEYDWSDNGDLLGVIRQKKNKDKEPDSCYAMAFDAKTQQEYLVMTGKGTMKNMVVDRAGQQLAFVFSADTAERKLFQLYYWSMDNKTLKMISDTISTHLPENWTINEHYKPHFAYDGGRLFFGSCPKPPKKEKDSIPEDEKVKLDIWHWDDGKIQPEQLKKLNEAKKQAYLAVYDLASDKIIQLADEKMERISLPFYSQHTYALGIMGSPYEKLVTWEGWYTDFYTVNTETGERKLVLEKHFYRPYLSPNGQYLVFFKDSVWNSVNTVSGEVKNISKGIPFPLYEEDNDVPTHAQPYGFSGFINDSTHAIINDRYDAWLVDLSGETAAINLTSGRTDKWQYRLQNLDRKDPYFSLEDLFFSAQNENTKKQRVVVVSDAKNPVSTVLREEDELLVSFSKAEKSDKVLYRTSTFTTYPDLMLTDLNFSAPVRLTEVNPQQSDYYWGSVELIAWKTRDGETLQGLLYTPENQPDSGKSPLLVYYYEKRSQGLHRHYVPAPSASTINIAEYVSRGYVVFVPDITYKTGEPGQSAYRSIMSGTDYVLKNYPFIDSTRMGLQGQSWGGYQTAMLITMTNRFKAAMAGAPVSNMTSAYGGIRWGTGISRMFQYEKGQSRLGTTLWENREVFLKNSPLFYLDKVKTPLLIMHNDDDGAVPWYQGIELYMGLRRLEKPVWMLNYNGEAHNLVKRHNRKDLSIRMQQFFDHYLMGEPAPEWMKEGRAALEKEVKTAY